MPQPRRHRKRTTIVVDGRAVEVPEAPAGLSAARKASWAAYWQSPAGAASASDPNHADAVFRLWTQYGEYDRVTAELAKRPILSPGSMGQERMSPLAPRQTELLRRIESGERRAGIGGVVNQLRLPEVAVDPVAGFARMFADMDVPRLNDFERGGFDPRAGRPLYQGAYMVEGLTDEDDVRLAADRLRDGEPPGGRVGGSDMYRVLERAEAGEIDLASILKRAKARNRRNEALLLAEWKRLLAEAQQGRVPGEGWSRFARVTGSSPEAYRLALVDLLEEHINDAGERGVTWAQASPGRKVELEGHPRSAR